MSGGVKVGVEQGDGQLPQDDADGYGDVQGVFGAELGDFDAAVGSVDGFLLHSFYFVSEYQGVFPVRGDAEIFEGGGVFCLFDGKYLVSFAFQSGDDRQGVFGIFPVDSVLGTEGGFVHLAVFRGGGDAAKVYLFDAESVRCPEYGAYVVLAADVVQDDDYRGFAGLFELLGADSVQFFVLQFAVHGGRVWLF